MASGTGSIAPDPTTLNATYTPSAADITAGTVTLTLTSTGQHAPCGAATAEVVVTIHAQPAITAQPTNATVHAGSPAIMERCVKLAIDHRVGIGAHPGLAENFGRGAAEISPSALETLVIGQAGALEAIAGARMRHIKLHGALYHAVEKSAGEKAGS